MLVKRLYLSKKHQVFLLTVMSMFMVYNMVLPPTPRTIQTLDMDYVKHQIQQTLQEALQEDKGTGCDIPKLDPFDNEIMKFHMDTPKIECKQKDWIKCYLSACHVDKNLLEEDDDLQCTYTDILYQSDAKYVFGSPTVLKGDSVYILNKSDHVRIKCEMKSRYKNKRGLIHGTNGFFRVVTWEGLGVGYRPITPEKPPPGRQISNVLIFGFDSTSKNGFIRKMPISYKFIKEDLKAVVLDGYNVLGDDTPSALFPLLTGRSEMEHPECRRSMRNSGFVDSTTFIFHKLKRDGYRTAYFEDYPEIGTFQRRYNGFNQQPADHYLRNYYLEALNLQNSSQDKMAKYCVGGIPKFKLMMDLTDQFLKMEGKRFIFTLISDISHDDFNLLSNADESFVKFLNGLKQDGRLKNTLLLVMGDHGYKYYKLRRTLQGKLEMRLPFMAIRLPDDFVSRRPEAAMNLERNVKALTTPHDIYATILDVLDMRDHWNKYKVKGAELKRGVTLLEIVPKNRSCSEAGILPHWCTCSKWESVKPTHPLYDRTARALLNHINQITEPKRIKCALRMLTSIEWVSKKQVNKKLLETQRPLHENQIYLGRFGKPLQILKQLYQVKIIVSPSNGSYEATVTHLVKEDTFVINTREISRTNPYDKEPECVSATHPYLNMFCYCKPSI